MQEWHNSYSRKIYESVLEISSRDTVKLVSFDDWKQNGPDCLIRIWNWLDWKYPEGSEAIAKVRHEKHKNPAEAFNAIQIDPHLH